MNRFIYIPLFIFLYNVSIHSQPFISRIDRFTRWNQLNANIRNEINVLATAANNKSTLFIQSLKRDYRKKFIIKKNNELERNWYNRKNGFRKSVKTAFCIFEFMLEKENENSNSNNNNNNNIFTIEHTGYKEFLKSAADLLRAGFNYLNLREIIDNSDIVDKVRIYTENKNNWTRFLGNNNNNIIDNIRYPYSYRRQNRHQIYTSSSDSLLNVEQNNNRIRIDNNREENQEVEERNSVLGIRRQIESLDLENGMDNTNDNSRVQRPRLSLNSYDETNRIEDNIPRPSTIPLLGNSNNFQRNHPTIETSYETGNHDTPNSVTRFSRANRNVRNQGDHSVRYSRFSRGTSYHTRRRRPDVRQNTPSLTNVITYDKFYEKIAHKSSEETIWYVPNNNIYDEKNKNYKVQVNNPCPICYEDYSIDKMQVMTPCKHIFHSKCLYNSYVNLGVSCPLCRSIVFPIS